MVSGTAVGEAALADMVPAGGNELAEGVEATLSAMVSEMWTAYEVLAKRVRETTDDARPELRKALNSQKDVGLRSEIGIRNNFKLTFASDGKDIQTIVEDPRIRALALLRHIIVHQGGKRDEKFNTRSEGLTVLDHFKCPGSPEKINLTRPIVLDLIRPIPELS